MLQKEVKELLVNESLIKQLNEIIEILRCRRIIDTKIALEIGEVFKKSDVEFIEKTREDLEVFKEAVEP